MPPRNSRRSSVACKASSLSPCVVVCPIRSPYLIVERGSTKSTFWINGSEVDLACLSGSAITDGANPLKRSQRLVTISKIPIGVSNHHRLTTLDKLGEIMKTKVYRAHHADAITPHAANP